MLLYRQRLLYVMIIIILTCLGVYLYHFHYVKTADPYRIRVIKNTFLNGTYNVYEITNILSEEECKLIIQEATPKLTRSGVMAKQSVSNIRTSTNTFLHIDNLRMQRVKEILTKINKLSEKFSGKPQHNQEPLQVVRYTKDQEYKPHYDCCVPLESTICTNDRNRFGLRHSTFLIYLNNVEKGGFTAFPKLNHRFEPKMGNAIFFFNLTPDESTFHEHSQHAGLPPLVGEKWVCNKWVRTQAYL